MRDECKTKEKLIGELAELRQRISKLEAKHTEVELELRNAQDIILQESPKTLDISTLVMQVCDGVLVAILNGKQDSGSAQQFAELVKERIVETHSSVIVVDMTDVSNINTELAKHLTGIISTVRLLGNQVVLAGVHPSISRSLAHPGFNLSGIKICPSLASGLWDALDILELESIGKEVRQTSSSIE